MRYNIVVNMQRIYFLFFIFAFIYFTFSAGNVYAKVITGENGTVNIANSEVVDDDLFIGAQTVNIDGTVNGDAFIGAQTVKITGIINGNLHAGANTLLLEGKIKGNVYAGAQNIIVSGADIGGSLIAGAATVNLDKSTVIGGTLMVGTGSLTIDSQIGRSVYAGTGNLTIGGSTIIGKDLYYASGKEKGQANISANAKIIGNTYKSEIVTPEKSADLEPIKRQAPVIFNGAKFIFGIFSFIGALIVGFIYMKLFPKSFTETSKLVSVSFWKSFGIGFLVTITFIPAMIILLITVVGIPVAGLVFLSLLIYSYLAKIVVGSALGSWFTKRFNMKASAYGAFALGLLVFYILKLIPFVGFLAGLVVLWVGLGAFTMRLFSKKE